MQNFFTYLKFFVINIVKFYIKIMTFILNFYKHFQNFLKRLEWLSFIFQPKSVRITDNYNWNIVVYFGLIIFLIFFSEGANGIWKSKAHYYLKNWLRMPVNLKAVESWNLEMSLPSSSLLMIDYYSRRLLFSFSVFPSFCTSLFLQPTSPNMIWTFSEATSLS